MNSCVCSFMLEIYIIVFIDPPVEPPGDTPPELQALLQCKHSGGIPWQAPPNFLEKQKPEDGPVRGGPVYFTLHPPPGLQV